MRLWIFVLLLNSGLQLHADVIIKQQSYWCDTAIALNKKEKITVAAGATLTITNSHLYGCESMWQGIIVEPGGHLIIDQNSIIEDAEIAVAARAGAEIDITNSTFDKNYMSLSFKGGDFATSSIYGNTFQCSAPLKAPHLNELTDMQIYAEASTNLNIGNVLQTQNSFSDSRVGVVVICTDANILNNSFSNFDETCAPFDDCNMGDAAIYAVGPNYDNSTIPFEGEINIIPSCDEGNPPMNLLVGGTGNNEKNIFTNCNIGVISAHQVNATIIGNEFDMSPVSGTGSWGTAILSRYGSHIQTDIHYNKINNTAKAIDIYGTGNGIINVTHNEVNNLVPVPNSTPISNGGIWVRSYAPGRFSNDLLVEKNKVKYCTSSILVTHHDKAAVLENTIDLADTPPNRMMYGIKIEGGQSNVVRNNTVSRTIDPTLAQENLIIGILIETSDYSLVKQNTLTKIGTSIRFFNTSAKAQVICNVMASYIRGVYFGVSDIGGQGNATAPGDNVWFEFPGTVYNIENNPTPFQFPQWYVRNEAFYNPIWYSSNRIYPSGTIVILNATGQSCYIHDKTLLEQQNDIYDKILQPGSTNMEKYKTGYFVFNKLNVDDTLKYLGTEKDLFMRQTFDSLYALNFGDIEAANEALQSGDSSLASSVASSLSSNNNAAFNEKELMRMIAESEMEGHSALYGSNKIMLENMAWQNPITGGAAVYGARGALGLDIDDYTTSNARMANITNDTYAADVLLQPNPTTGITILKINHPFTADKKVVVMDMGGRIIYNNVIYKDATTHSIDISNESCGNYLLQIRDKNQIVFSSNLVLQY